MRPPGRISQMMITQRQGPRSMEAHEEVTHQLTLDQGDPSTSRANGKPLQAQLPDGEGDEGQRHEDQIDPGAGADEA